MPTSTYIPSSGIQKTLEPCIPRIMTPSLFQQRTGSCAPVVDGQGASVQGNAFYVFQHHHHYTSMEGWGGHCQLPGSETAFYSGLRTNTECQLHINVLELWAVCLTLFHLFSQSVLIESDNVATMSYQ